jgi:hypothetical protein
LVLHEFAATFGNETQYLQGFSRIKYHFHALLRFKFQTIITPTLALPEGVKKLISFFFTSFRRKPESSVFKTLAINWTPVFTGVTAEIQFFHTFPHQGGGE